MGHLCWFQYLNNSFLQGMQAKWGGGLTIWVFVQFVELTAREITNRAFNFRGCINLRLLRRYFQNVSHYKDKSERSGYTSSNPWCSSSLGIVTFKSAIAKKKFQCFSFG